MLTTLDWLVIVGGLAAAGAVAWFFFGAAQGADARPDASTDGDGGSPPAAGAAEESPR